MSFSKWIRDESFIFRCGGGGGGVHLRGVGISLVIYWGSKINKVNNPWRVVRGVIYFSGIWGVSDFSFHKK